MGYKNFQEAVLKVKLTATYVSKIIFLGFIGQILIFSFLFYHNVKDEKYFNLKNYVKSFVKSDFMAKQVQYEHHIIFSQNYQIPFLVSFASHGLIFFIFSSFNRRKKNQMLQQTRGAKLVKLPELIKALTQYKDRYISIGGYKKETHILTNEDEISLKADKDKELMFRKYSIEVPQKFEFTHFCIIGKSGSGKTSLINPVVKQIRERGDRMVIHDYKGDFTKNFYSEHRDLVFNPTLPLKCLKWSIFNDIVNKEDIKSIVNSLIPAPASQEDPFWKNAARDILTGCLIALKESGKTTNRDIYELTIASNETIENALSQSQAAARYVHVFDKSNQKTLNSIMSVFRTYTSCFEYLAEIDGDFSVKDWVLRSNKTIFVQNREAIKEAIAPALTLFIDTISRELLSQDDRENKTVFILDEFGRLNKMSSILDLLTNGRSKGASIYILAQEFAQIEARYDKEGRKTIVNACSNQIYFSVNDAESAKEISEQIGDEESLNEDESIHHRTNIEEMEGYNIRKHKTTKKVVLASEILNLREREFLIKLNSQNWTKAKVFIEKL